MDFKTLIETWARTSYLRSLGKQKDGIKLMTKGVHREGSSDFLLITSFERLKLRYDNVKWDVKPASHGSHLEVYKSGDYFSELSDFNVRIQSEEKTKAKCTLLLEKGKMGGLDLCASISLPDIVRVTSALRPFGDSIPLDHNEEMNEAEREQNWTIDINVPVSKNIHTNVTMTIQEQRLEASFTCTACLRGSVAVQIFSKSENKCLYTVDGDIFDIISEFKKIIPKKSGKKKGTPDLVSEITCDDAGHRIKWDVAGKCTFVVGVNQTTHIRKLNKSVKGQAPQPPTTLYPNLNDL